MLRDIEWDGGEETHRVSRSGTHSLRSPTLKLDVNVVSDSPISNNDMEIEAIHSSSCSSQDIAGFGHNESRIPIDFCKLNLVFEKQENEEERDSVLLANGSEK